MTATAPNVARPAPAGDPVPPPRLSRTDQVIDVLRAGGYLLLLQAHDMDAHPTLTLHNADRQPVGAWLAAVLPAKKRCSISTRRKSGTGIVETWELAPWTT